MGNHDLQKTLRYSWLFWRAVWQVSEDHEGSSFPILRRVYQNPATSASRLHFKEGPMNKWHLIYTTTATGSYHCRHTDSADSFQWPTYQRPLRTRSGLEPTVAKLFIDTKVSIAVVVGLFKSRSTSLLSIATNPSVPGD